MLSCKLPSSHTPWPAILGRGSSIGMGNWWSSWRCSNTMEMGNHGAEEHGQRAWWDGLGLGLGDLGGLFQPSWFEFWMQLHVLSDLRKYCRSSFVTAIFAWAGVIFAWIDSNNSLQKWITKVCVSLIYCCLGSSVSKTTEYLLGKRIWKPCLPITQYSTKVMTFSGISCTEVELDDLMAPLVFKTCTCFILWCKKLLNWGQRLACQIHRSCSS